MLHIVPTMNAPSGRILLNDSDSRPLTRQADGSLTGSFTIDKQGFYRIELEGPHGEHVMASPQYTIDVTADRAPTVSFLKPGRDTMATPVEELFVEAKASDDFGVKELELVYAVNGGKEKTVKLFGGPKALTDVSAGHTIYLEELGLNPGRLGVLLRARDRQRYGAEQDRVERHLLRADPPVQEGLQAGAVAGGRRRWRRGRRQRRRPAVAAAEGDRRRDVQRGSRQRRSSRRTSTARTWCSSRSRRAS